MTPFVVFVPKRLSWTERSIYRICTKDRSSTRVSRTKHETVSNLFEERTSLLWGFFLMCLPILFEILSQHLQDWACFLFGCLSSFFEKLLKKTWVFRNLKTQESSMEVWRASWGAKYEKVRKRRWRTRMSLCLLLCVVVDSQDSLLNNKRTFCCYLRAFDDIIFFFPSFFLFLLLLSEENNAFLS